MFRAWARNGRAFPRRFPQIMYGFCSDLLGMTAGVAARRRIGQRPERLWQIGLSGLFGMKLRIGWGQRHGAGETLPAARIRGERARAPTSRRAGGPGPGGRAGVGGCERCEGARNGWAVPEDSRGSWRDARGRPAGSLHARAAPGDEPGFRCEAAGVGGAARGGVGWPRVAEGWPNARKNVHDGGSCTPERGPKAGEFRSFTAQY